uniref:Uncharacterized protein n=1 Tax=Romanomermis culicivorax TaxID=13658 RepID=A0A915I607_ROMCU
MNYRMHVNVIGDVVTTAYNTWTVKFMSSPRAKTSTLKGIDCHSMYVAEKLHLKTFKVHLEIVKI